MASLRMQETYTSTPAFNALAMAIERDGHAVADDLFDPDEMRALATECRALDAGAHLRPAGTGHARVQGTLRGDRTRWFDPDALSEAQAMLWQRMEGLRRTFNRRLLLGLEAFEAHYAVYPPGAGYVRHLDRLRNDDARVLSAVLYLNDDWREADGGALRLYFADGTQRDILPCGGRLVLFLSAEFEHEVLPATRERASIAGWFRQRN
jgi:SM-20-related protein